MAGSFYARYVPNAKKVSTPPESTEQTQKRKRDLDVSTSPADPPSTKKQKKSQTAKTVKEERKSRKKKETAADQPTPADESYVQRAKKRKSKRDVASENRHDEESKKAADETQAKRPESDQARGRSSREVSASIEQPEDMVTHKEQISPVLQENGRRKAKERVQKNDNGIVQKNDHTHVQEEEQAAVRHSRIMERYVKSLSKSKSKDDGAIVDAAHNETQLEAPLNKAEELVVAHGLEPLPQPDPAPDTAEKPMYSSEPPWLINPTKASSNDRAKFSELGVGEDLIGNLEKYGYTEAFAVQASVIPLLLPTPHSHPGDVCISAATGSGKTLSYILPLVNALRSRAGTRLRGLIVVPTRELVRQAREVCEMCAAGSGLRIGSAVGNVALKDEQRTLMQANAVYNPEELKRRSQHKMNADDWSGFNLQDYIAEAEAEDDLLPGYINEFSPGVDILICTPGRLVDHIRFTKGFSLRHVEWLVVDEADRLLNESFQEWVEVVLNSLDERKQPETNGPLGKLFADLRLPVERPDPKKVILSATMTRDLSKLNSLRLSNPKLVVVGTEAMSEDKNKNHGIDGAGQDADTNYILPSTLKEFSVTVGEGSDKPLFLLHLLLKHIHISTRATAKSREEQSDSTSSSSSESDMDDSTSVSSDDSSDTDTSSISTKSTSDMSSDSESSPDSESGMHRKNLLRPTALIFAKSSEAAVRLSRLLSLLYPPLANRIGTIVKSNKSSASRRTLSAYRRGRISIIIATDRASRGLDLPSLTHVVNYDMPTSVTTYIHRVGRTARAGQEGYAWTLVAHREGRWFSGEIAKRSDGKIKRARHLEKVNIKLSDAKAYQTEYEEALDALELEVRTGGRMKQRSK